MSTQGGAGLGKLELKKEPSSPSLGPLFRAVAWLPCSDQAVTSDVELSTGHDLGTTLHS